MQTREGSVAPRGRVLLTCDAAGDEGLPFKILLLGDYTQRPELRAVDEELQGAPHHLQALEVGVVEELVQLRGQRCVDPRDLHIDDGRADGR